MTDPEALTLTWARSLSGVTLERASAGGIATAIASMIDTIGVTLAGAQEPAVRILCGNQISAPGLSTLIGLGETRSLLDAALINGTAAHAIDYDDMAKSMGGHPSVPLIPVVLGLGEELDSSGKEILEAFVVGFEAECRVGLSVHPHHYGNGWHPTSTLGIFGAAAAAARLLGLDIEATARALALSASMASGLKANFGSMTKPFHVGHAARSGLMAALMVRDGFTANLKAMDDAEGFFAAYDGLDNVDPDRLVTPEDGPLEIDGVEIGLKQFACCGSTHPAVLAALKLRGKGDMDLSAVDSIEIRIHPQRIPHTDNPDPRTALASKFSQQYAVSRALVSGPPRLADFEGSAFMDEEVRAILPKVKIVPEEGSGRGMADLMGATVSVIDTGGSTREARIEGMLGRGPANPMSDSEMWDKFSDCGRSAMPDDKMRELFERLLAICEEKSGRALTGAMKAA